MVSRVDGHERMRVGCKDKKREGIEEEVLGAGLAHISRVDEGELL